MGKTILAAGAALFGYVAISFAIIPFAPDGSERLVLVLAAGLLGWSGRTWSWPKVLLFAFSAAALEMAGVYLATAGPLRHAGPHSPFLLYELGKKGAGVLALVLTLSVGAAGAGYLLRKRASRPTGNGPAGPTTP